METIDFISENMLILIPTLGVLGMVMKKTKRMKDKYIPATLTFIGVLLAVGLGGLSVESAIQGILVTGATVLGNETIKQFRREE